MDDTPTLEDAVHAAGGNLDEGIKLRNAQLHNLTATSASGVATLTNDEKSTEQSGLGAIMVPGNLLALKKLGLLAFRFDDWFTSNIANTLAGQSAGSFIDDDPAAAAHGGSETRFSSRTEQWKHTASTHPINAAASDNVHDAIVMAAHNNGIEDHNKLMTLSWIESRWDPNAVNSGTGAAGLFQFMPGTARHFGLTDPHDPAQSADAAARLWNMNENFLREKLGRDVSGGEVYLAHQQGMGGAAALLLHRDETNKTAADVLEQYTTAYQGRHDLAVKAITQNGGTANMTAGEFADLWINRYQGAYEQVARLDNAQRNGPTVAHGRNYNELPGGPHPDTSGGSGFGGQIQNGFTHVASAMRSAWDRITHDA